MSDRVITAALNPLARPALEALAAREAVIRPEPPCGREPEPGQERGVALARQQSALLDLLAPTTVGTRVEP